MKSKNLGELITALIAAGAIALAVSSCEQGSFYSASVQNSSEVRKLKEGYRAEKDSLETYFANHEEIGRKERREMRADLRSKYGFNFIELQYQYNKSQIQK